jgi:AraC family transcriptional regulator
MHSFGRHLDQPFHGGLTPSKVQRTTASIQAHLEHALSLVELAAVTPTSPTHFAHLFKQATGQTPHQYVFRCRMERAKHLLTGTTLPLHEIGARIGYADHSHFTALLRQYVAPPQGVPRRHIQGVSAPPARFAHDSHIGRKNVTDGGGRLCYSSPE